jgi:hypothetical protein
MKSIRPAIWCRAFVQSGFRTRLPFGIMSDAFVPNANENVVYFDAPLHVMVLL